MASYKAQQSADLGKDVVADQIEEEYIEQSPDNDSISNTKQVPQSSESKKAGMPASFMEQDKEDYTGRCEVSAIQQSSDNEDDERKTTIIKRKGKKRKTIASEKFEVDDNNSSSDEEVNTEIEFSHSERKRTKTTAEVVGIKSSDNELNKELVRKRRQRSTNMSTKSSEILRKRKKLVKVDNESSSIEEISPEICSSSSIMKTQCISDVDSIKHQSFSDISNLQSSGMITGSQISGPGQDNKPNLLNLMTLSTSEGDINIIEKTAVYYDEIGTYLLEDYGGEQVDIIERNKKGEVEPIMREIYQKWIAKDLSRSWAKLAKCFRKCTRDLHSLASIIEQRFELPSPTKIHSQSKEMTSQVSSDEEQQSTKKNSQKCGRKVKKSVKQRKTKKKTKANSSSSTSVSDDEDEVIDQSMSRKNRKKVHKRMEEKHRKKKKRERIERDSSSSISDTESDDSSSQEHDELKNLSRAESKQFKRIYTKFYGKLCCLIENPVEIAADFQMRGFISRSVMRKLCTPLYSQQEKTNQLIDAVYERIQSNPGRIYSFIELLLCSVGFENIGRQMWKEIGAVCPARTAAKLVSELPPSSTTDNVHEIQTTVTQTSQVQSLSSVTPSVAGNSIPPMTGQCTSPVLLEYRKYLQSYYKARNLAAADKYLPTLDMPYISLAIVTSHSSNQDESDEFTSNQDESDEFTSNQDESDEFTKATLHGGVDQILKIKEPIVFQDLLTPSEGSDKPVRFILVEGPPGIGKSTFAWEVCRRWEDIPTLKAYNAVVLLKLHERWVLNATSLAELFRYPGEPEFSKTISKELNQSQGLNLLLILDGFDEVSHSFHDNSVIKHILNRVLLPECTIILTTRPSAKSTLKIDFQPLVNKHLEIIGFPEEERVKYITEVFSKQPELQVNFLKYMFNVPHIKSMMYIPLNCAIIAKVCSESKHSSRLAIPRTRTQLYKALIHSFLVRYMSLNGGGITCSSTLPECLPIKEMELFKTLAKFAFDSYHEGVTKKFTFFEEDIPRGLVPFGLMNESIEMYADKGMERSYSFLHLSLQEYLAAWHIAISYSVHFQVAYHYVVSDSRWPSLFKFLMLKPKDFSYYKGNNTEERALITKLEPISSTLGEPAVFLAGITGLKCESVQKNPWERYLYDLDRIIRHAGLISSVTSDYKSIALRSLYEAQNTSIIASNSFCSIVSIGHDPYDSYAVSYCISHCSIEVPLDIKINGRSSSIEAFCRGLHDHCKSTVLRVHRLTVEIVDVDAKSMHWLADTIITFMSGVKHISITIKDKNVFSFLTRLSKQIFILTHALPSLKNLKSLTISDEYKLFAGTLCNTPPSHPICQALENSVTKLELNVELPYSSYDVKSPTALFINDLLTSILRSKLIRKLLLPNISRENMANVHAVIIQCPNLVHLTLMSCRLGYDGMLYICNALRYNSSIEEIQIEDYEEDINHDRASYPLKEVPLPNRATCTDIILGLNDILKENDTLEKLSISTGLFQHWTSDKLIKLVEYEPFAQFNVGRIRNGTAHGLRRSYSLSDLTPLNTTVSHVVDDDGKIYKTTFTHVGMFYIREVFLRQRKKQRMKMCYNISFTAPDTDILTSFSHLDPRLKKCLCITDSQLLGVQRKLIYDIYTIVG